MQNETKVGLLVVVALAGLGWLSVKSGALGTSLTTPMRDLGSTFSDVEGIMPGSPVKMAGVVIGEVQSVKLRADGRADVMLKVKKDVPLAADVGAQITTSGIIGEKFVAIVPGVTGAAENGQMLAENTKVIPAFGGGGGMGDMAGNFSKVGEDLEAITGTLRKVLGNDGNAEKIQTIIDGFASFAGSMEGSGDIVANLQVASESLKTILSGNEQDTKNMIGNFGIMAENMARITERLENGEGPLGQLLMGDASGTSVLGDMNAAMKDLREVMAKVNSGEGTLGKLINDPQTAEKLDNALDTFSDVSNRIEQLRTEVAFEANNFTNEPGVGEGSAMVTIAPRPNRFYVLGVTSDGFAGRSEDRGDPNNAYYNEEFGDDMKVTAQFGHVYQDVLGSNQDVSVRVGLKNSTGGVGVDTAYPLPWGKEGQKLSLSADAYDFGGNNTPNSNSPHVDLTVRTDIVGNTLYGTAGYNNMLNSEYGSPFFGLGLRFQDDDLKYLVGQAL